MKKKTYIIPVCEVVKIETQQMLASSPNAAGLEGFEGYGGDGTDSDYGD